MQFYLRKLISWHEILFWKIEGDIFTWRSSTSAPRISTKKRRRLASCILHSYNSRISISFFFFLISNLKVYWKNTAPYIGNVLKRQKHQENKVQCSSNPEREIQGKEGKTKHHSRRVEKKKDLNSRMDRSRSSKLLEFRSRQIRHIK